jgi:hypothetical protein
VKEKRRETERERSLKLKNGQLYGTWKKTPERERERVRKSERKEVEE